MFAKRITVVFMDFNKLGIMTAQLSRNRGIMGEGVGEEQHGTEDTVPYAKSIIPPVATQGYRQ